MEVLINYTSPSSVIPYRSANLWEPAYWSTSKQYPISMAYLSFTEKLSFIINFNANSASDYHAQTSN